MDPKWNRETILRWILERDSQGLRILAKDAVAYNSYMHRCAVRSFGSWTAARAAAGIKIGRHNRHLFPWTARRIVAAIRRRAKKPMALSYGVVTHEDRSLYEGAKTYFGSWRKALLVAGIDPLSTRQYRRLDKSAVIEAILDCALRNAPLAVTKVRPRRIAAWGIRLFGSWPDALRAAGLEPTKYVWVREVPLPIGGKSVGKPGAERVRWSKERIGNELHARLRARKRLNMSRLHGEDRRLYSAIRQHFGTWESAMRFCNLDPEQYRGIPSISLRPRCTGPVTA